MPPTADPSAPLRLDWANIQARGLRGEGISEAEALAIGALESADELAALLGCTEAIRLHHKGRYINTCGISNAKSGRCPEKCNFCSQSAHFQTEAPRYSTKSADVLVERA